jgi:hypothetical protein
MEITIRKVERRKIEGMNQIRLHYIYTWKFHKETPCLAILNKNCIFYFTKLENRKPEQVLGGEDWYQWWWEEMGKGFGRVNVLQILCPHVCKWKNDNHCNCSRNWGQRFIKENDEGDEYIWYIVRTFANATMHLHPSQQLKKICFIFLKKENNTKRWSQMKEGR